MHAAFRWPALHLCVLFADWGRRRQWLWNHTDIYNLNNLPLLSAPAELPLLNNSDSCSDMDMPVHLTFSPLSPGNTFQCFSPQFSVPSPYVFHPLPVNHHWLWDENNELFFFSGLKKPSVCKTAHDGSTWNQQSNTFAPIAIKHFGPTISHHVTFMNGKTFSYLKQCVASQLKDLLN